MGTLYRANARVRRTKDVLISRKRIGGSSSINGMIYIRGHPDDFDNWQRLG
ncbi:GMC family oxidoreductase N-terminal domain-containing protein [Paraburkholderia youngii]|uniref:Glucose-methanol-choline oxidoreductase N-terminal domain-containing protein n=1 Tax=Paraburkholderia youngii TaxID=2782701 RepID=A0A7Y6JXI8_9BURK|nr:hypothetical protein [Paraburkholderia youngii]